MKKISLGILTYKRMDFLFQLINDINKVKYKIDLIILNNNEELDNYFEVQSAIDNPGINLIYIWNKINYGVSKGRRIIVDSCQTDYLILLDDDVHLPNINIIIEKVSDEFDADNILGGIAFNIIEFSTKKSNRYEIPHKNKNIDLEKDFFTYLMIGAGLALRRTAVKEAGNFSQLLGPYGFEEVDVSFRIINQGYKIKYVSDCLVEHKKSPDGRFSNELVNYYAFVNRTMIAKMHLKTRYFVSCLIIRSLFFLIKTRDFSLYVKALKEIMSVRVKYRFENRFYDYCKTVKAFLYY